MSFLEKLLQSGAPWWVVVGLIVLVVGAALMVIILAPDVVKRLARGGGPTQHQSVIINHYGTDNPFDRLNRRRSARADRGHRQLADELKMLKSDGDEVHVYEVAPEKE